jgi:hypothetical protein
MRIQRPKFLLSVYSFLAYFPYFEKTELAYEITLLSVLVCVFVSVYTPLLTF